MAQSLAGLARVAYEATGLTEFRADNTAAERSYRQSTEGMSDAAIKLELSQERLRRSLAKGPAASQASARALLQVRQAERELATQSDRTTRELQQQERSLGRLTRGAVAGSGVFHGLGRSVAFASGTFLGGAGLIYALRSTIEAGRRAEATQGRVALAVRNSGIEYQRYREQIRRTITAQSNLSAFDDEDLADSFAKLVIRTKDVNDALRLNGLAADVARGRNISLEAATQLVIKASLGQAGQLRRVGIEVDKNAKAQVLLNKLTEAYSGQAARYGREGAGAQERLGVAIENTQELIAKGLLPTVTNLSNGLADWLSDSRNQERIQRDVNEAVDAGVKIGRGLVSVLDNLHRVASPVIDALGGIEHAAELAFGLALVAKARRAAASLGLIGTSSARVSAEGVAQANAFGRAWDIATRPRNLVVTTTTTGVPGGGVPGVPGAPGAPQRPTTRGRTAADRINQYGRPPATPTAPEIPGGTIAGLVLGGLAFGQIGEQSEGRPAYEPSTGKWYLVMPNGSRFETSEALIRRYAPAFWSKIQQQRGNIGPRPDEGTRGPTTNRPERRPSRRRDRGEGLSRFQRLTLAASRAELTGDLQDDLRAAKDLESYYAQIASNRKLHGDKLFNARQDLLSQQQRVQAIEDQIASDRQAAEDKAAANRKKAHDKRVAAQKKAAADRKRQQAEYERNARAAERALPGTGISPYATTSSRFAPGGISPSAAARLNSGDDKPLTAADVRRMQLEFLQDLQGITNQFGGNFNSDTAQTATHAWRTSKLTEQLVTTVNRLASGVAHPGAKYARMELMEPFGSVGSV